MSGSALSITLPAGCGWRTESYGYDTRLIIPLPHEQTRKELSREFFVLACQLMRERNDTEVSHED